MRIGYADPPYPGMAKLYKDHPDYGGEVDHLELVRRLERDYDAWVLHTAATTLQQVLAHCPEGTRVGAWVKPFASIKKGVQITYAWEPVLFHGGRRRPNDLPAMHDWISCGITLQRGLTGVKPEAVCRWAFDMLGATADDELEDLFPGSGAVTQAWEAWCAAPTFRRLDYSGGGAKDEDTIPLELSA